MNALKKFEILLNALFDLNELLLEHNSTIELTIVGSMAIYLNGLNIQRMTEDIDYINYDASSEFITLTQIIAKKHDLPNDWINSRAQDIEPLPANITQQLKTDNRFSNIKLKFINTDIAIQLKVYAYNIRGLEKDLSDLIILKPTREQLQAGLDYTKMQIRHHHGESQLLKDKKEINHYWEFLTRELRV
jgi:hypothetical protein